MMPSFNDLAGVPMTANRAILHDLVRERWGFDGVMISDSGAIGELMQHGVGAALAEAAELAGRAGADLDMITAAYSAGLHQALDGRDRKSGGESKSMSVGRGLG